MKPSLRIKCFGTLQIKLNGKILTGFETDKARALLAYLAVESDRPHRRSQLAGLLWSEETEDRALHNLRQTLSSLRKTLRDGLASPHFILADRESIQLNPAADVWVDVLAFTQYLDCTYQHYQSQIGRGLINIRYLKRIIDLYQGQFLNQFFLNKCALFEEWVFLQQEKYNLQAIKSLAFLAEYHERRAEYNLAIQTAMRIVEISPWDEIARMQVIRLLGVVQQWNAAQGHFFALKKYLSEELDVAPSAEVTALYNQIRAAAAGKYVIEPRFKAENYHLPDATTSFVGRETEMDEVMELIVSPAVRLVTLVGPGGIGKTRFALEIAHELIGVLSDGVFFVPLVAAQASGQINQFIAKSIGLDFSDQSDPQLQLLNHLRDKELLLVLDNFEHLLTDPESTRLLDEILSQTANVTILVTSRERLMLQQERFYSLTGLTYPQELQIPVERASAFEALNLFISRADQIQRNFVLNEANLPAVIRICRVLEGFPLGVELAAAAIWEYGFETIAERIEKNLDVLTSNFTNIHPRHRSLRAAFDASWELLTPKEQVVLQNLSIFRDSFDQDAALQIASASPGVLSALGSKSLLRVDENRRFNLHEAIRQFAAENLIDAGRLPEIRSRHAQFFGSFLANKNADLKSTGQPVALADIQQEFGNISLMWDWLVENKCALDMIDCADSLYQFFNIRSLLKEGMQWFQQALTSIQDEAGSDLAMGMLLSRLGSLAYTARESEMVFEALLRSQEILIKTNALHELAACRIHLGWAYQRDKNFGTAQGYGEQSLAYFQSTNDNLGQAQGLSLLGSIQIRQGNNREGAELFDQALVLCRKTENPRELVTILNRLGDLACHEGQYQIAVEQFSECLAISKQLNDRYNQAVLLNNLGTIYHIWKEYIPAHDYYQKSLELCRELGDQDGAALALNNLGELATLQGDYLGAIKYSEAALQIAEQIRENWTVIVCLNSLGEIYREMVMLDKSKSFFTQALKLAVEINEMNLIARISVNLARVYQLHGDHPNAIALLQAALSHPSTEHDSQEKAVGWLKEMNAPHIMENHEPMLAAVVTNLLSSKEEKPG